MLYSNSVSGVWFLADTIMPQAPTCKFGKVPLLCSAGPTDNPPTQKVHLKLIGQLSDKIQLTFLLKLNDCMVLKWSPEFSVCLSWSSRKQSKARY